jgi:2-succinyl-5-enolpyruvyl-6-hydroxy-3-cyclohexene-1-carboxylate synthase
MSSPEAIAAANAARADDVVDALLRHGVRRAYVCPGSRSTPLVLALVRREVVIEVFLDERVAAFAAVGAGRVGAPAVVVTTSGTAVANLLPACAEAARDAVGLVCVTADRSGADVALGASQSLSQPPLLAGCARAVVDLSAPEGESASTPAARSDVAARLDAALGLLRGPSAGPIHLNVRFDKPLEPPAGWTSPPALTSSTSVSSSLSAPAMSARSAIQALPAGVVVVGALPRGARGAAEALIARLRWPVVVDVAAGIVVPPEVVRLPTVALRVPAVRESVQAGSVLWLGGLCTEDATTSWVQAQRRRGARVVQLSSIDVRRDPARLMDDVVVLEPAAWSDVGVGWPVAERHLVERVRAIAAAVDQVLVHDPACVDDDGPLTEPGIARAVSLAAAPGSVLWLGNSMPIRDVDRFGAPLPQDVELVVNRGVAGIDGNIATALGACLASARPGLVLLGDLAALHDLSGLVAVATRQAPLRIVVVNNDGGGIFSFLPVESTVERAVHERLWGTPHGRRLAPVAASLGLQAAVIHDRPTLRRRLATPIQRPELLEVVTDRADNVAVHHSLDRAIAAACSQACSQIHSQAVAP